MRSKGCWAGVEVSAVRAECGEAPRGRLRGCEGAFNRMYDFLGQNGVIDKLRKCWLLRGPPWNLS